MILYLIQYLSDLSASCSYVVAKKFYKNGFYSTTEIFAYCNVYIVAAMLLFNPILKKKYNFNLLSIKDYVDNKTIVYATLLSVSASYFKTILLSNIFNISQLTLRSYSLLCPFITLFLCHFFLKDQKLNKSLISSFAICFVGFLIFNSNAHFIFKISSLPVLYVFINSYSDYKLKAISHKRGLEMMLFDNLMFLFISIIVFLIAEINEQFTMSTFGVQKFTTSKILNTNNMLPLFIIGSLSFLAHNFKMLSYKAKHIVGIVIIGIYFKSFNSILMTYIEYETIPSLTQFIGLMVMSMGLGFFMYKNFIFSIDNKK